MLTVGEKDLARKKPANRAIYEVEDGKETMCMITDASRSPQADFTEHINDNKGAHQDRYYPRQTGIGPQARPYNHRFTFHRGQKDPGGLQRMTSAGPETKPLN
jgi:hypothetical protein